MNYERKSVNVQLWISASQACMIAEYLKSQGVHTRLLSDLSRTAIEWLCGLLQKNRGMTMKSEADALHFLEKEGYSLASSKRHRKGLVKALQEESLADIEGSISDEKRAQLEKLIQEQGG